MGTQGQLRALHTPLQEVELLQPPFVNPPRDQAVPCSPAHGAANQHLLLPTALLPAPSFMQLPPTAGHPMGRQGGV